MAEEIKINGQIQETLSNWIYFKIFISHLLIPSTVQVAGDITINKTGQHLCPTVRMVDNVE